MKNHPSAITRDRSKIGRSERTAVRVGGSKPGNNRSLQEKGLKTAVGRRVPRIGGEKKKKKKESLQPNRRGGKGDAPTTTHRQSA